MTTIEQLQAQLEATRGELRAVKSDQAAAGSMRESSELARDAAALVRSIRRDEQALAQLERDARGGRDMNSDEQRADRARRLQARADECVRCHQAGDTGNLSMCTGCYSSHLEQLHAPQGEHVRLFEPAPAQLPGQLYVCGDGWGDPISGAGIPD